MSQSDVFRKLLDAGLAFGELTRNRAEALVRDLVRSGEIRRDQAQEKVEELLERSRRNTEQLAGVVRREIATQLRTMGLATNDDLDRLEQRLTARLADVAAGTAAGGSATASGAGRP
ncbi:MAG: phasin family protein [Acidimicrobiales bacterium]